MNVVLRNVQRSHRVDLQQLSELAECVLKELDIDEPGTLAITLVGMRRMRKLNKKFKEHDWETDVLSFRYPDSEVRGDIVVAPAMADRYSKAHDVSYSEELARYIIHGLLHWSGLNDSTAAEKAVMRESEDRLLRQCNRKS